MHGKSHRPGGGTDELEQRHRQAAEELENGLDGLRGAEQIDWQAGGAPVRKPSRFPKGCGRSSRCGIGTKADRARPGL